MVYVYRGVTFCAGPFLSPSTSPNLCNSLTDRQLGLSGPTTPHMQRLSAITHVRFGLFRVRSPLLTESLLFSFPMGTEMFHFPTFPPTALCVQAEVARHDSGFFRGFPIRRSPDRSSFTSSPGLIAGYNVLHRLLMPRHPPIALSSLLFTTRCSRPLCSSQVTGGTGHVTPTEISRPAAEGIAACATDPSGPNSVLRYRTHSHDFHSLTGCTDA